MKANLYYLTGEPEYKDQNTSETISRISKNILEWLTKSYNIGCWSNTGAWAASWALKKSLKRPSFLLYFPEIGKKRKHQATDLTVNQFQGSTIATISAHVPGQHLWASAGQVPSSSSPKQWKLDGHVKIYNSVSARSPLTKSNSNIKSAHVSALTGSVPRKMAKGLQRVLASCKNQIQVARHSAAHLNH